MCGGGISYGKSIYHLVKPLGQISWKIHMHVSFINVCNDKPGNCLIFIPVFLNKDAIRKFCMKEMMKAEAISQKVDQNSEEKNCLQ